MAGLCEVTSLTAAGCCGAVPNEAPAEITNPPGQAAVVYRIGTFSTFRERLLAAIPGRLPQWKDRGRRDYGVVLLEMWATLADILTFYQERIANEAFLRTARRRESLVRIADLVDYRLNPGAAAAAYLVFTVEAGKKGEPPKRIDLQPGLRCQTKPTPQAPPVPFETDEALTAHESLNVLRVESLQDQTLEFGASGAVLQGAKLNLRAGDRVLIVGDERLRNADSERWDVRTVTDVHPDKEANVTRVVFNALGSRRPHVDPAANAQVYALRVQAWPFGYNAPPYRSVTVSVTTTPPGTTVTLVSTPAFEDWTGNHLPEEPAGRRDYLFLDALYPTIHADSWIVLHTGEEVHVPSADGSRTYRHPEYSEAYRVKRVDETVHANYTITAKATRLTLDTVTQRRRVDANGKPDRSDPTDVTQPENIDVFPMQGTSVLAQSDLLPLAKVPKREDVSGNTLILDARYPDLSAGRLVVVTGRARGRPQAQTEVARVKVADHTGPATRVTLEAGLQFTYDPTTVTIHGNVAPASHGETIADEIVGSGNAALLFQQFTLKKKPLTFVRASGAEANRWGTQAALEVRVNGVRYHEREHLLDSGPSDRDYVLTIGPVDDATLTFGGAPPGGNDAVDGEHQDGEEPGGALLPTGRDNVRATYRKGLGGRGNVKEGAITTLLSTVPGLKSVTNPLSGTGGAEHEGEDQVKANLPAGMRAFDRAVSLEDYEALARTYAGVAKARAFWQRRDPRDPAGLRRLEQPRVSLTVAATDRTPPLQPAFRSALRVFLDARRDPHQPLVIADFTPISVDLSVTIEPEPDLLAEDVRARVAATLSAERNPDGTFGLFAFERLDFGMSLHLSDIYAAVQGVSGVHAALVTKFQHFPRPGERPSEIPDVETHLFIQNTEILRCDNDPADLARGTLRLTIGAITANAS